MAILDIAVIADTARRVAAHYERIDISLQLRADMIYVTDCILIPAYFDELFPVNIDIEDSLHAIASIYTTRHFTMRDVVPIVIITPHFCAAAQDYDDDATMPFIAEVGICLETYRACLSIARSRRARRAVIPSRLTAAA